jgi:hypothetical protein
LGESEVACQPDGKGFWSNCNAVGCIAKTQTVLSPSARANDPARAAALAKQAEAMQEEMLRAFGTATATKAPQPPPSSK